MNVLQFLRILWAYRLTILACVLVAFGAAVVFVQIAKPRYEAQARVMLDVVKPDPVTGQVIATAFLKAYTKTQVELVKDNQIAARVVNDLGWANNPGIQQWYRSQKASSRLDFSHWAAQQVVEGTDARLIEGSNILEIQYSSGSPARAREVADALRKAYVDMALQGRRETARRNAEWYEGQAEKTKIALLQAEQQKAEFERSSGIILQDNKVDLDSARLAALAGQGAGPTIMPTASGTSSASMQLAQLDADIAAASKTLGPNHPQLVEMKRRRELLAKQAIDDTGTSGAAAAAAASAQRAVAGLLEQQKAKVVAQREKVEQLRLLEDQVNLRQEQYNQSIQRAAQLRQEAEVAVSGVTPLGAAVMPLSAAFPNKPLIIGASIPGGLGLGLVLALLLEFVGRRIRGMDDVAAITGAPVLAVIRSSERKRKRWVEYLPRVPARGLRHARPASS
ncbi:MAG: hypothetical protein JF588_03320 [Caulobacterales bacterium]|nr:hypothetical protein [Caulobacterales bacterium]